MGIWALLFPHLLYARSFLITFGPVSIIFFKVIASGNNSKCLSLILDDVTPGPELSLILNFFFDLFCADLIKETIRNMKF